MKSWRVLGIALIALGCVFGGLLIPSPSVSITGGGYLSFESSVALAVNSPTSGLDGQAYAPGDEIIELRDQYSSTYLTETGSYKWSPSIESKHYQDDQGGWQVIDTAIASSDKPNWDWEVVTGHWHLFVNNDTTVGIKKGSNWVGHRLHAVGYYDASTKDYVILKITNTVTPVVTGNSIVWTNIIGGVDYQIAYTNDSLKEDIIVKQSARDWLNQVGNRPQDYGLAPATTYVGAVFECDWSQGLPMKLLGGTGVNPDDSDVEETIYFEATTEDPHWKTKLVSFLPVGYAVSENPTNPEDPPEQWEYASEVIRKRFYNANDKHWLILGALVIPLNQMPDGSIIFDPTETLRPSAAGDECNVTAQSGCSSCPSHYDCVYDITPDEDSTRIQQASTGTYYRDLYNIADSGVGEGTINHVKVYARCKASYEPIRASLKIVIKTGGTAHESSEITVTTSYVDYSETWNQNPTTSSAWTWSDIDNLQVGVSLAGPWGSTETTRCTQVYPEVDYEEALDISNTPSTYDFGNVTENETYSSGLSYFTVTNNSGAAVDISIQGTDLSTGGGGDYYTTVSGLSPTFWWKLDGDMTDSADALDGSSSYPPDYVSSIIPAISSTNQCGDFNGSDDVVNIPDSSVINTAITDEKSISVWIQADTIDTTGNGRPIWSEGGTYNWAALYVWDDSGTDKIYWCLGESSGSYIDYVSAEISVSTVYQVGAVFDGTTESIYLYLNGSLADSKTGGLNIGSELAAHSANNAIGSVDGNVANHNNDAMSGYFDGEIADFGYWAEVTVLDGDDFDSIYDAGTTTAYTWDLSDTATPGSDIYGLKAGLSGGSYNITVKEDSPYNDLVTSLADSGEQDWGLQMLTPSTITDYTQGEMTGTVTLTATLS